jgi:succinate-acetate transporter protein
MSEQIMGSPGLSTPGEAALESLPDRVHISLRPIGGPTAIGFFGLAAATLVVSGLQLDWVGPAEGKKVALVLVGFAFAAQILAAVFCLLARDGVAATAMSVLALTWLVIGLVLLTSKPGSTSGALGLFLLVSGAAMVLTSLTTVLSKLVPAAVFGLAALRFFATAGYELSGQQAWEQAAGALGLLLLALALYAAWAAELEDALGRTVLPLGRRGRGKIAIDGSLLEQVKDVATRPGIREQL